MYGQMNRNMRRSLAAAMDPTQMMRQAQMRQGVGMGGAAPTPGGGMGNPMMQAQGAPQAMGMPPVMSPLQQAPHQTGRKIVHALHDATLNCADFEDRIVLVRTALSHCGIEVPGTPLPADANHANPGRLRVSHI